MVEHAAAAPWAIEAVLRVVAPGAMLALDRRGDIAWLSQEAERLMGRPALPDAVTAAARRLAALAVGAEPAATPHDEGDVTIAGRPFRVDLWLVRAPDRDPVAVGAPGRGSEDWADRFGLTRAESRVLELLGQGLSNREIAARRFVSVETVRTHVQRVLGKLGVSTRVKAAVLARLAHSDGGADRASR